MADKNNTQPDIKAYSDETISFLKEEIPQEAQRRASLRSVRDRFGMLINEYKTLGGNPEDLADLFLDSEKDEPEESKEPDTLPPLEPDTLPPLEPDIAG